MTKIYRKTLVGLDKGMLEEIDRITKVERRMSRTDLIREACRIYVAEFHEKERTNVYQFPVKTVEPEQEEEDDCQY